MKASLSPIEPKTGCLASCMDIIGNKWTALILRDLAAGPRRFSELERSINGMSPRTLSQRLDNLETHDIINKTASSPASPHMVYNLTNKGRDLIPVLKQMAAWGTKYYSLDSLEKSKAAELIQ